MKIGTGYYSLERLRQRREREQHKLVLLNQMIERAHRLKSSRRQLLQAKYADRDARIRKLRRAGLLLEDIGNTFGLTKNRISQILSNGHRKN